MRFIKKLYPPTRPYWHVDAKWISGIFLLFTLALCLLLTTAAKITDAKRAPDVAALMIGQAFIRGDSVDTETAKQELAKHGGVIRPLPNIPEVVITEADIGLSPQEISLKVFRPLTQTLYQEGIEGAADRLADTPEQKDKFIKDAFFLKPFTKQTHDKLSSLLTPLLVISVLLALTVVYFSAGWGRLSNPGFLLLLISLPGTLISLFLLHPPQDDSGGLGALPSLLTNHLGSAFSETYTKVTWLGLGLLAAALAGKIYSTIKKGSKKHQPEAL